MSDTTVLRTTKIGNGFVKDDVWQYLNELNTKINEIQKENEALKKIADQAGYDYTNTGIDNDFAKYDDKTVFRTTKVGNGFIKEDVIQYIEAVNSKINAVREENKSIRKIIDSADKTSLRNPEINKDFAEYDDTVVLRTTKIGNGFVKDDVIQYIQELNSEISNLTEENKILKKVADQSGYADEIRKCRNQIEILQEKVNNADNLLKDTMMCLEQLDAFMSALII